MAEIYMDGIYLGKIDDASEFIINFRDQRKNGRINEEVSILTKLIKQLTKY